MTIEPNILEQFHGKYEGSGRIGRRLIRRFFSAIEKFVPPSIASAAEIGCGIGVSTERLRAMLAPEVSLFASDIDPELVAAAKSRGMSVTFGTESVYALDLQDETFDLVFCLEVLEHLDDPDRALAELLRVTRRFVILSVPREPVWRILNCARGKYWRSLGNTPGHLNHWSRNGFASFVSRQANVSAVASPLPWTVVLAEKRKI